MRDVELCIPCSVRIAEDPFGRPRLTIPRSECLISFSGLGSEQGHLLLHEAQLKSLLQSSSLSSRSPLGLMERKVSRRRCFVSSGTSSLSASLSSSCLYPFPVVSGRRSQEVVCPPQRAPAYLPHYLKGLRGLPLRSVLVHQASDNLLPGELSARSLSSPCGISSFPFSLLTLPIPP